MVISQGKFILQVRVADQTRHRNTVFDFLNFRLLKNIGLQKLLKCVSWALLGFVSKGF